MKKMITIAITLILASTCIMVALGDDYSGDWDNTSGDSASPWITSASTPTTTDASRVLWKTSDAEGVEGMGWVNSTGAPISVGGYTYFAKTNADGHTATLYKVITLGGTVSKSAQFESLNQFTIHIAYGGGMVFALSVGGTDGNLTTTVKAFDANTLAASSVVYPEIAGADLTQNEVTYHDGYLYFGTYTGNFAIIDAATGTLALSIDEDGWYNAYPVFVNKGSNEYAYVASKAYGSTSTIYIINTNGFTYTTKTMESGMHVQSGGAYYEGRVYFSAQSGNADDPATIQSHVYSYNVNNDGTLDGMKSWTSANVGGTQSAPVVYNNRIYLGSGGEISAAARDIDVITIDDSGNMNSLYTIPVKTKGTLTLTTAYTENQSTVYLYCVPYISYGENDVCIIKDNPDITSANYSWMDINNSEYSFLSVGISSEGCLLVKTDASLFCCRTIPSEGVLGDLTNDGKIKSFDKMIVAQAIARTLTLDDDQKNLADIIVNNKIDTSDKNEISKMIALKTNYVPPETKEI